MALSTEEQRQIEGRLAKGLEKEPTEEDIRKLASKEDKVKSLFRRLGERVDDVKLLWNMLIDYKNGRYTNVPWKLMAAVVFFFTYLLLPMDVIPDIIPIVGFTDDLGVLTLVLAAFTSDIDDYKKWLASQQLKDVSDATDDNKKD